MYFEFINISKWGCVQLMHNIKRENKNALKKYYTLTYPQLSIWQTEKVFPNTSFGNIVGIAYLKGELDFKLFEEVINSAVEKMMVIV